MTDHSQPGRPDVARLRAMTFDYSSFTLSDGTILNFEGRTLTQLWQLLFDAAIASQPTPDAAEGAGKTLSAMALVEGLKLYPTLNENDPHYAKRECFIQGYIIGAQSAAPPKPAPPDAMRTGLQDALGEIVLVIAFLERDGGTDRLPATIKSLTARLVKADHAIRDILSAPVPSPDRQISTVYKFVAGQQDINPEVRDQICGLIAALSPPVRGGREAIARAIFKSRLKVGDQTADVYFAKRAGNRHAIDFSSMAVDAAFRDTDTILSLPGSGEREAVIEECANAAYPLSVYQPSNRPRDYHGGRHGSAYDCGRYDAAKSIRALSRQTPPSSGDGERR